MPKSRASRAEFDELQSRVVPFILVGVSSSMYNGRNEISPGKMMKSDLNL